MRPIKFRCFVPAEGDYYYIEKGNDCWLQFMDDKSILFIEDEKWESGSGEWVSYPCVREVDDFIIEQFTGLCDKNGKEIYEGDVVRITNSYYGDFLIPIVYDDSTACFSTDNHKAIQIENPKRWDKPHADCVNSYGFKMSLYSTIKGGYSNICEDSGIEIIGNIHENPELLK